MIEDGIRFYEAFLEEAPEEPLLRLSTGKAWMRLGELHILLGELTKCQAARKEAIRLLEALHAERTDDPEIQRALAQSCWDFGECEHWILFHFASANVALRRALTLWRDLADRFPDRLEFAWNATAVEVSLADNYKRLSRLDEAEAAFRHAVAVQRRLWNREAVSAERHHLLCWSLDVFSVFLAEARNQREESESLALEAVQRAEEIVARHPESVNSLLKLVHAAHQYGNILRRQGKLAEAEKYYQRAVEAGRRTPRVSPLRDFAAMFSLFRAQLTLAEVLEESARDLEALALYRSSGDLLRPGMAHPEGHNEAQNFQRANQGVLRILKKISQAGQHDKARQVCENLAQVKGDGATALLSRLLAARAWEAVGHNEESKLLMEQVVQQCRRLPQTRGHDRRDAREFNAALFVFASTEFRNGDYEHALPLLDLAIQLDPANSKALENRGRIHLYRAIIMAEFARFDRACADLKAFLENGDAPYDVRYQAALLALRCDDERRYREICTAMAKRFASPKEPMEAHFTAWACALAPNAVADYAQAIAPARRALEQEPESQQYLDGLGAILMRAGQYEEAIQTLEKALHAPSSASTSDAYIRYFLAMTEHHLGHSDAARERLQAANVSAVGELNNETKPPPWNRKLTLELLRKEAEALIGEAGPAPPEQNRPAPPPLPETTQE